MTGGKRLTEVERQFIFDALDMCDPFAVVLMSKEILERDDEPEYCTWKEHPIFKGCFHPECSKEKSAYYPGMVDAMFCQYCGKPVKV